MGAQGPGVTYRVVFTKDGPARWIGHLDVMRLFERAFRRCRVPVAHTQGHNPRPRLRFVFPASVSMACLGDVLYVDLMDQAPGDTALPVEKLNETLPEGVRIREAEPMDPQEARRELAAFGLAVYRVRCSSEKPVTGSQLEEAVQGLLGQGVLHARRRDQDTPRMVRLSDHLVSIECCVSAPCEVEIRMTVRFGQAGTLRPTDFVEALSERVGALTVRRLERVALLPRDAAVLQGAAAGGIGEVDKGDHC